MARLTLFNFVLVPSVSWLQVALTGWSKCGIPREVNYFYYRLINRIYMHYLDSLSPSLPMLISC